jgi:hypothetical protein
MKKNVLLLIFLLVFSSSFSQEKLKRKAVFVELLGSGIIGSVNYDFRFKPGNDGLGMKTGFGFVPKVLIIPIELNGVIGKKRIAFEYGGGISAVIFLDDVGDNLAFSNSENFGYTLFAKAGIRVTPKNKGLFFSFNWNPIINSVETRWTWFGLGIGYSWHK